MLKLQSLSELSKVTEVPSEAFGNPKETDVPTGAFDPIMRRGYSPAPAYVKFLTVTYSNKEGEKITREYAQFTFTRKFLDNSFKGVTNETRFELLQGRAPHKDWFQLRISQYGTGNRVTHGGVQFSTTQYINTKKMDKTKPFVLETVGKEGMMYLRLPAELVPLLR